jgi:hypothetical protein
MQEERVILDLVPNAEKVDMILQVVSHHYEALFLIVGPKNCADHT